MDNKPGQLDPAWRTANVPERFRVAVVGDMIMTHPIHEQVARTSPGLIELLQGADVVVGNLEGSIIDLDRYQGFPEAESGFGWLIASPEVGADLRRMGFHMLSRANNHATDWGVEGMRMTDAILRANGLVTAGTGSSLTAARAPSYLEGAAARVSLVSWTTTFERNTPAMDALGAVRARPGANTLGTTPVVLVSEAQFQALQAIRDAQPAESRPQILQDWDQRMGFVTLFGQFFKRHPDASAEHPVTVHYEIDKQDWALILKHLRQAKQTSDFAVAACHSHEPNNWTSTVSGPTRTLGREAVANGADLVCGHGSHQFRGIQLVDGKPVFHSLGDFCFMSNSQAVVVRDEWERRLWRLLPDPPSLDPDAMTEAEFMEWTRTAGAFGEDLWFESFVAVVEYGADGRARRIELHPIELGNGGRDALRGIPRLAQPGHGQRILARLAELSAPLGTRIDLDPGRGFGLIEVP
jgi:poly-gamma-glutamate synthesis protein (capsule biosynthesis protein)